MNASARCASYLGTKVGACKAHHEISRPDPLIQGSGGSPRPSSDNTEDLGLACGPNRSVLGDVVRQGVQRRDPAVVEEAIAWLAFDAAQIQG